MKRHLIVAAAALALAGGAFAADEHRAVDKDRDAAHVERSHPTAGEKLRGAMHRIGEKTRRAFHRGDDRIEKTVRRDHDASDTRSMGAPGHMSDEERARRQRMDDAYDNWRHQQKR